MKHIRKYIILAALLLAAAGCEEKGAPPLPADPPEEKPDPKPEPEPDAIEFTSFRFRRELNLHILPDDVECTIDGDEITGLALHTEKMLTNLIPTFEGTFDKVRVGGVEQKSGANRQDFSKSVYYTLTDANGYERTYRVTVRGRSGLPVVHIDTDDSRPVESKTEYTNGAMTISNIPEHGGNFSGTLRIRGRGNATWSYEKRPYRIKLDKAASLAGLPESRDWALLAEYCDKSLLRNTYLWEMSKIAGMEWTCRSKHVEMWLNGDYLGTYLLCESVREGDGRVELSPDGFIIERDNYWYGEPLSFGTTFANYTFKYPDARDGDILRDDDNYNYIVDFMRRFETALVASTFKDPAVGYRKYLDAESFAKWYLVQEVLGNIDTNPYYVLRTRGAKLEMYPVWDAEWSLGCAAIGPAGGWLPPPTVSPVEKLYWKDNGYFARLTADPWFCDLLRSEWEKMKRQLPELRRNIAVVRSSLSYAQADNFKRWNVLGRYISAGLLNFPTWEQETTFAASFLERRISWFDERLKSFPN